MSLFAELKRRNVVRVGFAYVVIGWVLAQIAEFAFENFGAPEWVLKTFIVLLLLGLPLALFFAWAFEITPEGIVREEHVDRSQSITSQTGRKLDFVIIAFLVLGLGYFFWESRLADGPTSDAPVSTSLPGEQRRRAINMAAREIPSIAVLPFVNISDDKSQEYFADGLSEELLNLLAQTRGLKVTARTSSFAFKGQSISISEIAEALNVKTVLEGSVRRAGNRVRVTAQLINAADGYHLWSQSYDREMIDVFELQDDIAGEIIVALRGHLETGEAPSRGRPTDNFDAYNLYLQALDSARTEDFLTARDLLNQAIELAPDFAKAYEQLAITWWSLAGVLVDLQIAQAETHRLSGIALKLNPDLAHAQTLYLSSDMANYDRYLELQSFEQLVFEQPQNSKARMGEIYNLIILGYFTEAVEAAREAVALDPLFGPGHAYLGQALYATGDVETARKEWSTSVSLNAYNGNWYTAIDALRTGDDELALLYLSDVEDLSENYTDRARAFITIGRDPERNVAQLVAAMQENPDDYLEYGDFVFLGLGLLDEFYDLLELLGGFEPAQTNAEYAIQQATPLTGFGFTAHPRYVEMATAYGLASVWDRRGPPDYCSKIEGHWICH